MRNLILFLLFFLGSPFSWAQEEYPLETVLQNGHTSYITAYDFSSDGALLVTGSFDNVLILWDMESGKQIRTFSGHTKRIRSVHFSPDQKFIGSVSADNSLKVTEVISGEMKYSFTVANYDLSSAYFSQNGHYIYGLDNRDGVYVWDLTTGDLVGRYVKEYGAHVEGNLISPDETEILSLDGYQGSVSINLLTGDTTGYFPFDKIHSQSYSPNGEYIAISSRKLFASIFEVKTGKLVAKLEDGEEKCDGCNTKHVFSPDSKYVLTMSNRVGAVLWDVKTGQKLRQYHESTDRPTQLLFSSKGSYLLVGFDDLVLVFDTKTGKLKLKVESDYIDYFEFQFSPNEQFIVLPNKDNGIDVWNVNRGKVDKTIRGYLSQSNSSGMDLSYSNWIDQSILSAIQSKRKILLSPNDKYVMVAGIDSSAQLIDLERGKVVKTFVGHSKSVIAFDFSPDGKFVATGGGDRLIKIWDSETGQEVKTLSGHQETIFDLKFTADGSEIVSGAWDGTMRVWNIKTGRYQYVDLGGTSPYSVGCTPNELYLISADLSENLQFWEKDGLQPFRQLIGFNDVPSSFDFSPDGKTIATASWDGKVKVWDVLTGMLIGKMNQHSGRVFGVKYDPLGRFIASCGADNKIILWDPIANKISAKLEGYSSSITSIDITKDGQRLVSISADGVVKVWDLNTYQEVFSRVQLSRNEWLSTAPSGLFDGSRNALNWVNYVKGNQVINVNSLFEKYYTPDLIRRIQANDPSINDRGEISIEDIERLPGVTLALGAGNKRSPVLYADSVFYSPNATIPLEIAINSHTQPLSEILIYNNGKLVQQMSLEEGISFRNIGATNHMVSLTLSNGVNRIEVVLVDQQRTSSSPAKVLVEFAGDNKTVDLFLVTIGINLYKNPTYNLDYAVNDAQAFAGAIQAGTDSLFNRVFTYSILNEKATKAFIMSQVADIKSKIGPEDVFLFYYAGHGVMSNVSATEHTEFFVVTHDVTNLYDETKVLREKAVSAAELMQISMGIAAEKQLFILDACHSGGAIEAFAVRGNEREKALAQLARNTGTFFLTASQDAEYANEVGQLNHGLFTYALLEILQGAAGLGGDSKVTVSELKSYVEDRVPELSETYHGSPQYPTGYSFGRDFPIVILK